MYRLLLAILLAITCKEAICQLLNTEPLQTSYLNTIGATAAWSRGFTGAGVKIGIIDNGFDLNHTDLSSSISASKNFYNTALSVSWGQHGTQMASIAAGNKDSKGTVGVAPDAMLLLGQAGPGGTNSGISQTAVIKALDWMSLQGASVVNMSFGFTYNNSFYQNVKRIGSSGIYISPSNYGVNYLQDANTINGYANATNRNTVLVVSAGNQGLPYASFPAMWATRTATNGSLILQGRMLIVGAIDNTGNIAGWSNKAGTLCQNVVNNTCKDNYLARDFFVVAPGSNIYGATPSQTGYGNSSASNVSGTSPAAALVSGGIALMKQAWPQLKAEQLVALTLNTAKDLGTKGVDDVYGYGLVDFDAATKPQGNLKLASTHAKLGTGTTVTGNVIMGSSITTNSSTGQAFTNSQILRNIQTVDDYGRNYTINLSKALANYNAMSYQYASPWLGLNSRNYQTQTIKLNNQYEMQLASVETGGSVQINYHQDQTIYQIQMGAMSEHGGFLGNLGSGVMSLGNSSTTWTMMGIDSPIYGSTSLIAQYGIGITQVANDASSIVNIVGPVYTDYWRLAVSQNSLIVNRDRLVLGISAPVAIRKGVARISAVTSYTYDQDEQGDYIATPVSSIENISLRPVTRELDLGINYILQPSKGYDVSLNLVRQFNVAGQAGLTANAIGITLKAQF